MTFLSRIHLTCNLTLHAILVRWYFELAVLSTRIWLPRWQVHTAGASLWRSTRLWVRIWWAQLYNHHQGRLALSEAIFSASEVWRRNQRPGQLRDLLSQHDQRNCHDLHGYAVYQSGMVRCPLINRNPLNRVNSWTVGVAQLVEWSLPTLDVRGLNQVIEKMYVYIVSTVLERRNK